MQFDPVRQRTAVLAPERVYWPDATAAAILSHCNGECSIAAISNELAEEFDAPPQTIQNDVIEFVQEWLDLRLLKI
jgi:pyrroloquinoline quinone biosynthesis protein D